jgi:hypothetical protein
MPLPKPITKEQILAAMGVTKSNRAAARYLNCSYVHYKKWAKFYEATEPGYANLFEQHLNQAGKGIPKWIGNHGKTPPLQDLINGIIPMTNFSPTKVKKRLFEEGYLKEECTLCGFNERRVSDYKIPLLLNFKDKNTKNYRLDNLEVLCYNHYFLTVADVFNAADIAQIEDSTPKFNTSEAIDWELDEYHLEQLKKLGLYEPPKEDDGSDLISRL